MKTLLVLRHAKASQDLPVSDRDRPLTPRGQRQARAVGDWEPGAPQEYIHALTNLPDEVQSVMVVGHNPGQEDLLATFLRRVEQLRTSAVAHLWLPVEHWWELDEDTRGTLVIVWRPPKGEGGED